MGRFLALKLDGVLSQLDSYQSESSSFSPRYPPFVFERRGSTAPRNGARSGPRARPGARPRAPGVARPRPAPPTSRPTPRPRPASGAGPPPPPRPPPTPPPPPRRRAAPPSVPSIAAAALGEVVVVGHCHAGKKLGKLEVPRDGGDPGGVQHRCGRGQGTAQPRLNVAVLHVAPRDESV